MSVIKNRNNTNVYTTLNSKTVELASTFLVWVSASLRMLTAIQPAVLASSHSNTVFCSPQLFSLTNWRARWLCRSLVCISDTILHSWGKQFSERKNMNFKVYVKMYLQSTDILKWPRSTLWKHTSILCQYINLWLMVTSLRCVD